MTGTQAGKKCDYQMVYSLQAPKATKHGPSFPVLLHANDNHFKCKNGHTLPPLLIDSNFALLEQAQFHTSIIAFYKIIIITFAVMVGGWVGG